MKKEIHLRKISNLKVSNEKKERWIAQLEKKEFSTIPFIINSYHLSNILGVKWNVIKNTITNSSKSYYEFSISKKNGGKRLISMPSQELKTIQLLIKEKILEKVKINENAFGFTPNKSIKENAERHLNKEILLNIDLKDFFPSIHQGRVYYIFKNLCCYDNDLSYCLTKLTTYKNSLPQGAPTSPIISNIVAYMLDIRLSKLAEKLGITYTRYADDITFSGSKSIVNEKLLYCVTNIIEDCGFEINKNKTRFAGKGRRQEVTGLIVNNNKVAVSKEYIKEIRQEIYFIKKFGIVEHRRKVGFKNKYYKDHLYGKIMFVNQIDNEKGKKLLEQFYEIDWNN